VFILEYFDFSCQPTVAWLVVNQACNMRCKWCYGEGTHYNPEDSMTLETAKELVDIAIEAGVSHFNIIGGEPTIWQHILDLFDYGRLKGATVGLITNAANFGDDDFWQKYAENPADQISISVKSVDPEEFAYVTSSKLFEKTMKGIERAIKLHHTGVTTVYNSLVGMDGLKNIAIECKKLGANSIIVNMCSPTIDEYGVANKGYSVDPEKLAKDTIEMVDYLNGLYDGEAEVDIQMPLCLFPPDFVEKNLKAKKIMTLCQVFSRAGINFNFKGDVTVCNELTVEAIARKGVDFTDGASLLRHLNSQPVRDFYSEVLRYPAECCEMCRWKVDCRGGCLMNWLIFESEICHAVA
jgi:radical SAM protein with 4Fe4S-binding SPASM domain